MYDSYVIEFGGKIITQTPRTVSTSIVYKNHFSVFKRLSLNTVNTSLQVAVYIIPRYYYGSFGNYLNRVFILLIQLSESK